MAMSGGVDSSVAAALLTQRGYEVVGLFMRTGAHEPAPTDACAPSASPNKTRGCCSAIDAADAERVADRLDIPFHALDFSDDFRRIKDYFADEYSHGRTPNPCVVCNIWLKFGKLWDYAQAVGADYIATGHYARNEQNAVGTFELLRGADPAKDQSYFLFGIDRKMLPHILFPVGDLPKSQVREMAEKLNLGVHQKPDSQEICFVPSGDYVDFLRTHKPDSLGTPGPIVDESGRELGRHSGLASFTIGQRKGLGVAVGEPRYVLSIESRANRVVIGPRELLERIELEAERVNWLVDPEPTGPIRCEVKIRYLHLPAPAWVEPITGDGGRWRAKVTFDVPQSAVTPGQAAVFYQGQRVLGGGWIE